MLEFKVIKQKDIIEKNNFYWQWKYGTSNN